MLVTYSLESLVVHWNAGKAFAYVVLAHGRTAFQVVSTRNLGLLTKKTREGCFVELKLMNQNAL